MYVYAFVEDTAAAAALRERMVGIVVHAPHLLVAEVGSVARRLFLTGRLAAERALSLIESAPSIVRSSHPHGRLTRLARSLRADVSFPCAVGAIS